MTNLPLPEVLIRPTTLAPVTRPRPTDRERFELLLEAGHLLDDSFDLAASLRALARLLTSRFCDVCVIDLVAGDGPAPLAVMHTDRERTGEAHELRRRHPPRVEDRAGVAEVLRTGRAEIHAELLPREAEGLRAFRELGATSAMVAPIRTPGQVAGAITVLAGPDRRFDAADLRVLEELGARAGLSAAVCTREGKPPRSERDRGRLLALEKEARAAAEVAVHRIATLQGLTAALSEAVTLAQVADIIVGESVASLGARLGTLHLVDAAHETLELAAQRGMSAAGAAAVARLPLSIATAVVVDAVHQGRPLWILGRERVRAASPELARRLSGESDAAALAALPLVVGGRVAGVLCLAFDEPGALPEEERGFTVALVRHCAQAVDRARLYEAERRNNQRLTLLARASELLAASIEYEATLEAVARCALPALGDYCFFDVIEESGVRRVWRAHGEAPPVRLDGAPAVPATEPRLDAEAGDDALAELAARPGDVAELRRLGIVSMVTVPLVARTEALGALTFAFGPSGRRHTRADLEMAFELAPRAAIAVENAVLHRGIREAMERAQEANRRSELASRTKDDFLGVVSHELRTPLNAVLGWSQLLRGPSAADPAVLAKGLRVIDKNARAQAKLIEDILDVSRIITGKLRLELRPLDLESVIRAALEVIRPAAEAKNVELFSRADAGATVSGDPDRLQQVVWNLVSNAVKFTPEGGRVEVTLERVGTAAAIVVRDTGRGIEPDVLPHVFERFWQADSSPTRRHGGLGLGLAIARHLIELHGGSVCVESGGLGAGCTFTVHLPARDDDMALRPQRDSGAPVLLRAQLDGLRVLVVDDEPDARELVSTMLASAGAVVTTAVSAADALTRLARAVPDVLVSDLGMPGEDGHALIRKVRASGRLCRLPAVALTAYASQEDARRAVRAGFHTHLPKPVEPGVLAAVVASLAGRVV
jgi:signal transduction histidine kinase